MRYLPEKLLVFSSKQCRRCTELRLLIILTAKDVRSGKPNMKGKHDVRSANIVHHIFWMTVETRPVILSKNVRTIVLLYNVY